MDEVQKNQVLDMLIKRVILPYAMVGCVLTLLGVLVRYSPLPEIDRAEDVKESITTNTGKTGIFQFPHLILGAVAIFFNVGSKVIAIDTIIPYAQSMGISLSEAKVFPSYTLFATICGYLLGITLIPWAISQKAALRVCTLLGFVFSVLVIMSRGNVQFLGHRSDISLWFIVFLGFANSMIWAGIWPLALNNLGKYLKIGASLLIIGLCGNAILPLFYGYFADRFSLQQAYFVLLPCYFYLIFYAFYGHKVKKWSF